MNNLFTHQIWGVDREFPGKEKKARIIAFMIRLLHGYLFPAYYIYCFVFVSFVCLSIFPYYWILQGSYMIADMVLCALPITINMHLSRWLSWFPQGEQQFFHSFVFVMPLALLTNGKLCSHLCYSNTQWKFLGGVLLERLLFSRVYVICRFCRN